MRSIFFFCFSTKTLIVIERMLHILIVGIVVAILVGVVLIYKNNETITSDDERIVTDLAPIEKLESIFAAPLKKLEHEATESATDSDSSSTSMLDKARTAANTRLPQTQLEFKHSKHVGTPSIATVIRDEHTPLPLPVPAGVNLFNDVSWRE